MSDVVKADCWSFGGRITNGASLENELWIVPSISFWDVGFKDDSLGPVSNGASDSCARSVPGGGLGWRNGNSPLEVLEMRIFIISLE